MRWVREQLQTNVAAIRDRMATAAAVAGRKPADIRLIGVTKYVTSAIARELFHAGVNNLAESRPQEFWRKCEDLTDLDVEWHFVGHLQRNKIAKTIPQVSLLHSADSWRLLAELESSAAHSGQFLPILLEVNISGDEAKHGFSPVEMPVTLEKISKLTQLRVQGLMTMAALEGGANVARQNFSALRELRDTLRSVCPSNVTLDELSMGMSDDFPIAIEEGATMIRVGSALFEKVEAE